MKELEWKYRNYKNQHITKTKSGFNRITLTKLCKNKSSVQLPARQKSQEIQRITQVIVKLEPQLHLEVVITCQLYQPG